jgi:hypothetical protein
MSTAATPATPDHLHVEAWADPVVDRVGHDPRSAYVERFWLGVLGPSTTLLLRRLATELDAQPAGFDLDLAETSRSLGLGGNKGRHSAFLRAIDRTTTFRLARRSGRHGLQVRRHLPPLTLAQLKRLPTTVQDAHDEWNRAELARRDVVAARDRARRLALSLFEMGCDLDDVERELHRWHYHPAMAGAAAAWARDRHLVDQRAAARINEQATPAATAPPPERTPPPRH